MAEVQSSAMADLMPMVSNYVINLEEHLGTRLLNRTTRRLSLTESGSNHYESCFQIISDVQE